MGISELVEEKDQWAYAGIESLGHVELGTCTLAGLAGEDDHRSPVEAVTSIRGLT